MTPCALQRKTNIFDKKSEHLQPCFWQIAELNDSILCCFGYIGIHGNHGILCPVCVKIHLSDFYDRFLPGDGCQDNKNAKTDVPAQSINTDNLDNISHESLEAALHKL